MKIKIITYILRIQILELCRYFRLVVTKPKYILMSSNIYSKFADLFFSVFYLLLKIYYFGIEIKIEVRYFDEYIPYYIYLKSMFKFI